MRIEDDVYMADEQVSGLFFQTGQQPSYPLALLKGLKASSACESLGPRTLNRVACDGRSHLSLHCHVRGKRHQQKATNNTLQQMLLLFSSPSWLCITLFFLLFIRTRECSMR